ncbi:enoyl-CoA hydratase [Chitiniphilus shinanonensis]|uniref:Enoyl-CoA hydratase n=1 Tax=Chitiniphilus shinanonensis TaxID=553088 RepID=A0ABQ6BQJ1_9NEIS|nr:enoyl-CoA hydratase-related protein [Chitiniphilus shinanonensis]GLS04253.1 enoyl-CoA hydratase [Chitiniphilus shinanonensis]
MSDTLQYEIGGDQVARINLDRPAACNAFDDVMIAELTACLAGLAQNSTLRALVLSASGPFFCAGLDYAWLLRASSNDQHRNFEEALALSRLMQLLDRFPVPTIARVQGAAFGMGLGLIACCDLVVARRDAHFQLSEVRLGLVPAITAPYIQSKIGLSAARRYFLTAERIDGDCAHRLGLVHELTDDDAGLDGWVAHWLDALRRNGPRAMQAAKRLVAAIEHRPIDDALLSDIAHRIAHLRTRAEAQEGVAAHVAGRPPRWYELD